jgi:hypothetical protein
MQPEQLSLQRAPAQEDSETSVDAAVAIQPRIGRIDSAVLACIRSAPCTDQEGEDRTGIPGNTYRPARRRQERRGVVVPDGTRRTRSGRSAVVWRAVGDGEPPTRRSSPGKGASSQADATAKQHRQDTAILDALWSQYRLCRPSWLSARAHSKILAEANVEHPDDLVAALRQAVARLRELGGEA